MSRFDYDDGEGMTWELWEQVVSRALAGRRGQAALARLEEALVALPQQRLISSHLAAGDDVCAVGALVAYTNAQQHGTPLQDAVRALGSNLRCECGHGPGTHPDGGACTATMKPWIEERAPRPCWCEEYEPESEDPNETARAGCHAVDMPYSAAWHLAYLNDEQFASCTPEERYERMLVWVRRAQGKETGAAA